MENKIIIVCEYFYPNDRTDAYLLTEIAKQLAVDSAGNIVVICTSELAGNDEIEILKNKVFRLKNSSLNDNNLFFRSLKFLILTVRLTTKAIRIIKYKNRVFLTTNPAFLIPIISFLRIFKEFEYTLLVYDVFPENLQAAKILSKKNLFYKMIKRIYDWAYSKADRLIVLGRDMEEVIGNKITSKRPIHIIENWCDYKKVIPQKKDLNTILNNLELTDKIVFLFAGNLGRVQGIQTLLEASLLVTNNDFRLLFIGNGAMLKEIKKFISLYDNSNVVYGGSFSMSEQNNFLNACDVSIISLSKSMYGLGVPSKSYYNMAAEKPILYIGDERSEIARVVNEFNLGWTIEPNNPEKLALLIDDICLKSEQFIDIGRRSRETVISYFSKDIILEKYSKLYRDYK